MDSAQPRPRVLVLDEEIPWPANTGKRLRTLNLLTALSREFAIDYVTHANGATPDAVEELRRRGITPVTSSSRVPDKRGILLPFRLAAGLARGLPHSVHSHYSAAFRGLVNDLLGKRRYDLVHCEWTPYAMYAHASALPVCIAAHNVEWSIWRRMADAESRPLHRLLFGLQARLMQRFERRIFAQFRHATAVSDADAAIIRTLGCQDVVVVPNGVDATAYQPPTADSEEPTALVFTGSLDWRPNQDAIAWFISHVHPILRSMTPYRLYVVGRTPPAWLGDKSRVPEEIVVTGTVDDVRPWIARAAVYVVPLRVGGGSRLKILEALAMGRPVVSSSVGAEGLALQPGRDVLIADDAAEFAGAIHHLFSDVALRLALGRAGRDRIEKQYRWEQIAPLQGDFWRRLAATRQSDPRTSE